VPIDNSRLPGLVSVSTFLPGCNASCTTQCTAAQDFADYEIHKWKRDGVCPNTRAVSPAPTHAHQATSHQARDSFWSQKAQEQTDGPRGDEDPVATNFSFSLDGGARAIKI
jgi:hypothetical protein